MKLGGIEFLNEVRVARHTVEVKRLTITGNARLNGRGRMRQREKRDALAAKISNVPKAGSAAHTQFEGEVDELMRALAGQPDFHPGTAVRAAFARIRQDIAFMERDRAMDADVRRITELVAAGVFSKTSADG